MYTVDAAYYGNISHFVNHSVGTLRWVGGWEEQEGPLLTLLLFFFSQCDPNLQVYNVFIDNLDERLPRIAFFATRTIRAGEELTFDYNMQGGGGRVLGAGAHNGVGYEDPSLRSFKMFFLTPSLPSRPCTPIAGGWGVGFLHFQTLDPQH